MARRYVFDIETAPRPGIMDTWYPSWAAEKYPGKEGVELENMAALHAEFGMVCAIAYASAYTDDPPIVYTAGDLDGELELLKSVKRMMDNRDVILMGHNIKGFDIPFLAKRYMARMNFVPSALNVVGLKPWDIPHKDSMEMMRFGGGASMSLRSACLMLGIDDPKGSNCGSEVPEMFRQGRIEEIGKYCAGDVIAERALIQRLEEVL